MNCELKDKILKFQKETKLGDHRIGVLLADNGRLLSRIRSGRRVWPETIVKIEERMLEQARARGLEL